MTDHGRTRAHEVLSVPSRVALLDRLRASAEPLDAGQLAAQAGLHVSTVRFHLSALAEAGLVTERSERTGGRGRPRITYTASWAAEPDGGPYRELAELLATHLADTPALRAQRAEEAGADWAQRRGLPSAPADDGTSPDPGTDAGVEAMLTTLFTEMGFDPEPTGDGRVLLHACPFRAAALAHPEVVCAAHRGLLRSAVAGLDPDAPVPDLQPFVRPGLCVIAGLRTAPAAEGG